MPIIKFEQTNGKDTICVSFSDNLNEINTLVENFKCFCMLLGYSYDAISLISIESDLQDRIDIIKDRIKSALSCIEQKDYDNATRYITDAYNN